MYCHQPRPSSSSSSSSVAGTELLWYVMVVPPKVRHDARRRDPTQRSTPMEASTLPPRGGAEKATGDSGNFRSAALPSWLSSTWGFAMDDLPFDLAAQQLVELLELVSSFSDETAAQHSAVERAAQVLEAEVAAVVVDGRVVYSVGFPAGAPPHEQLVEVALGRGTTLDVPRLGRCAAAAADLDGPAHGHLVLARLDGHFSPADWNLPRGMARILDLSLRMLRTMDSLRQRQT